MLLDIYFLNGVNCQVVFGKKNDDVRDLKKALTDDTRMIKTQVSKISLLDKVTGQGGKEYTYLDYF